MAWGGRLITRRLWLVAGFSAPLGWSLAVPRLLIRREGANLRISAPQIRFLTGKALEQLKNGASVSFVSQILMTTTESASNSNPLARAGDRFVVSYDIWEENYAATRIGPPKRRAERLSVPACEAWCLDELLPAPPWLPADRPFWIKLELRTEDPKDSASIVGEPGISLTRLVEIFSHPPRSTQQRWLETAGPLRLQDL
jgi:hypothetical protein